MANEEPLVVLEAAVSGRSLWGPGTEEVRCTGVV